MRALLTATTFLCLLQNASAQPKNDDKPRSLDPRLEIVPFAAEPDIVHPIAVDFDAKGRLLVVESHTHFRPKDYKGPETDRIRIVEDKDGDGKADRCTTFHEGIKFTMDLAVHFDGSVYVATRNEILRLRDTDGDGKADEVTRLMFLDTKGNYPHNGLSGLCFDFKGDLYFGLGENLGESYTLKGADGKENKGGGEGGSIFWCSRDGKGLRRVATGFWNPFGVCRDVFGRMFAVDNDADAMPPCRLVHVVEGGDYGYQFRYGRSGRHPFQSWNGELPGTLPYVAGVGEAPCEVLAYESDGLPKDYLGTLLVTSWADHRLECYPLESKGASFTAKKKVVVQGGKDFRPVGLAIAPDGSLLMSDWVRRDYDLHGQGAIWQVRAKNSVPRRRSDDLTESLVSHHRTVREAAANKLALTPDGLEILKETLSHKDDHVRATSLQAIFTKSLKNLPLAKIADKETSNLIKAMAVRQLVTRGDDVEMFAMEHPIVQVEAFAGWTKNWKMEHQRNGDDPFIQHAIIERLARFSNELPSPSAIFPRFVQPPSNQAQLTTFLAHRRANTPESRKMVADFLAAPRDDIRFLTAKWISDDLIKEAREPLLKAMKDPNVNSRLYMAYGTALARLDGNPVNEIRLADIFLKRAIDDKASAASRVFSLRMVPTSWGGLTTEQLVKWTTDPAPEMRLEAVRALCDQTGAKRSAALVVIVTDRSADLALRREALTGLADQADAELPLFLDMADGGGSSKTPLSEDALRGLVNVPLEGDAKIRLMKLAKYEPALTRLIGRAIGRPLVEKKAPPADVDGWLKRLEGAGDPDAGRRVFFHPRLTNCARCHRIDGRGQDVGPDLGAIGQRERRFILESILHPSREVAPHFQTWQVETTDGKIRNGLLSRTELDLAVYIDEKGKSFTVNVGDIVEARAVPASIMPEGLTAQLTDQEFRDLLAYLGSRK